MMKKLLLATALVLVSPVSGNAQLHINSNVNDPVTGLPPDQWEAMVGGMLNTQGAIGDDAVIVVSSVSVPLTITCDRWTMVGPDVYKSLAGNPTEIRPFSITYMKTKGGFDGYCKAGVVGHDANQTKRWIGRLTSDDGSFKNATTIWFSGPGQR